MTLVLLRHGESEWNRLNLFTGWVDILLSQKGREESLAAGIQLQDIPFDYVYTSALMRAKMTAVLALSVHKGKKTPVFMHSKDSKSGQWETIYSKETLESILPVYEAWELNERMYGELQGLNKAETMEKFGKEQVQIWRRSFDISPPKGESLKDTAARTLPYFDAEILPKLKEGKKVLVAAHGNSLRSICMEIDELTPDEVIHLEIPTGVPIIYEWVNGKFVKQV